MITWQQLGYSDKPCGVLNVCEFYDHLLAFLDHATSQGFINEANRGIVVADTTASGLLDKLETYVPPPSVFASRAAKRSAVNADANAFT